MIAAIPTTQRDHSELMRSAQAALDSGLDLAAGVTARIVLEGHIKQLGERFDCVSRGRWPNLKSHVRRLSQEGHLSTPLQRQTEVVIDICNACAHNLPVETWQIEFAVAAVRSFANQYPMGEGVTA